MEPTKTTADQEYVRADDVQLAPNGGQKRGHKFCGGCCDVKRATIIVNLISIGMAVLGLIGLISVNSMSNLNDDQTQYAEEEVEAFEAYSGSIGVFIGLTIARMAFNVLGIWGAHSYTVWPVGASLAAFGMDFILSLITFNLYGAFYFALCAYPHIYLILELRNGIMTKETYDFEKHSCCCV